LKVTCPSLYCTIQFKIPAKQKHESVKVSGSCFLVVLLPES
jgi:hypothetical protein